ncbi:unnamed protein product [Caenorhabditis angaria]|uniref:Uncharacterized protein n=1 Tax=Caenorhabditis angaria TaxID=860376 RepID=A0A9P1NBQ1_9PELO|nr:unnamed protein product [Caenorhabditis angaria]
MNSPKKPCSVCGEPGDGAHFGAEACRACAAFFRRSVALGKVYVCRAMGSCEIQKNVRCMCRSCRYAKCIAVGMRKSAVQRHRDVPIKNSPSEEIELPQKIVPIITDIAVTSDYGMPTLNLMNENYLVMSSLRTVIHNRQGDNIFTKREPRALAYKEANNVHLKEIGVVADWVVKSFPDFERLILEQKKLVYRNFFLPFIILECGYTCCLNDRTDHLYLPSGDYIDCTRPEIFYNDQNGHPLMSVEDAVRMFGPSFDIYRRNILDPMRREKVDAYEFFTLCSLVLWDHGLEGQTEDCANLARLSRDRILREVLFYYRTQKNIEDPSMRLANLLVLLPALQRSVRRFQEDVEITHVFNVSSVEEKFYELVSGRLADTVFAIEDTEAKIIKEEAWEMPKQADLTQYYDYSQYSSSIDNSASSCSSSSSTSL